MDRTTYEALEAALHALTTLHGLTASDNGEAWRLDESATIAKLRAVLDAVLATTDPFGAVGCAWCGAATTSAAYVCADHAPPSQTLVPA